MKKRSSPQKLIRRLAKPVALPPKHLFLVFLVSIATSAFILGSTISSFFILAGLVLASSFVSAFLLLSKPGVIAPFKEIFLEKACLHSLALLTSLIVFSFLPYIVLWEESMQTLAAFALCLLPAFAVFFFSHFLYSELIRKKRPRLRLIFSSSVFLSLLCTAAVLLLVSIGMTLSHSTSQRSYIDISDRIISELDRMHKEEYNMLPDLPVVSEVKAYHESLLQASANSREQALAQAREQKFCFTDKCFETMAELIIHQSELLQSLGAMNRTVEEMQRELSHLSSGQYLDNFLSVEEYASHLAQKPLPEPAYRNNISSGSTFPLLQNASSPFQKSLSYAFSRTGMAREQERASAQVAKMLVQNPAYTELASQLSAGLGMQEPAESRIIRMRILLLNLSE
jgi:hypothetical protein